MEETRRKQDKLELITVHIGEAKLVLPPRPELGDILVCKDVALEIGEVDSFGPAFTHPAARGDVVGYKGRPDRGSVGGLGLILELRGYKGVERLGE